MRLNDLSNFFVSVISDSPRSVFTNLKVFEEWGIGGLHFDVMDGLFVPRLGLYPELLNDLRELSPLFVEVHMMLSEPSKYIELFASSGANRLLFHLESKEDMTSLITQTKALGLEVGVVLNPETSVLDSLGFLELVDSVMLMAIRPGIVKHPFLDSTFEKVRAIHEIITSRKLSIDLQIDGGVTFHNVESLFQAGAKTLVCGSGTVFAQGNSVVQNLHKLSEVYRNIRY